ncbi:hypothetical protein [Oceanobacter sp. 4_MG-2023]|uniref:hypothetical protein n=1 Tax=Oceanobacter sp. 4_MG-2023 TaxID=3062623 RepID=UPI002733402B|nr:hypothetical protein [Oceanobacter sp. 4_MG-2023]MDP2549103.1 hypothetical protein [Oceanobacter sp. 4_MG-2023]
MLYHLKQTTVYTILMFVLFVLSSCTQVTLVADYDKEVLADTFALAKRVDLFWANYLEAEGEDRKYAAIKKEVIGIEVDMNSLLLKNEARNENKQTTAQVENVIVVWSRTANLIKSQGSISNTSAKAYRVQLADAIRYIVTGEEVKNISNNTTNAGDVK